MSAIWKGALVVASVLALTVSGSALPFPDVVPLPTGFQPEGIAIGRGTTFFVGSIPTGAVYRGDLRTGEGEVLVQEQAGRMAIGMKVDRRARLFVAGGGTGQAYVYDASTGEELAVYQLAPGAPTFINDVVLTRDAAWFTDSFRPVLYRVPIGRGGALADPADVEELTLSGDYAHVDGEFNLNGIEAARGGRTLVVVQSVTGQLFAVDPGTGSTDEVELAGGDVSFGDGMLLDGGSTLYVVQNQLSRIAVVDLARDLSSGAVVDHLTDPDLDVPTTIADFGPALYAVNARFGNPDPANADYSVARLET
ncbi:MAG TPA: superoxide dismutase [Actinomycetota bacterium]